MWKCKCHYNNCNNVIDVYASALKSSSQISCGWATQKEQQNNRTNNHIIKYLGKEYTLSELGDIFNMSDSLINSRLRRGWNIEDTLNKPKKNKKRRDI